MAEGKQPSTIMKLFTDFATNPKNLRFENQEKSETVILFLRQHIIVLVPWILLSIVMVLAPTILFPLVLKLLSTTIAIPVGYIIVGSIFWYIATFGILFANFLYWFFNIYIVTNERIVDIDFVNLLHKDIAEAQLYRVQDISYQTSGIIATMFDYGDVIIQTASEVPNFVFDAVPKPSKVVEIIGSLSKKFDKHTP